jgi:hypothetical protein
MTAVRIMPPNTSHSGAWPVKDYGLLRRAMHSERIRHGAHSRVESAACHEQRFIRLQHDSKFDEIEAFHEDKRAGAAPCRNLLRIGKGIASLAQGHEIKARWQVEEIASVARAENLR